MKRVISLLLCFLLLLSACGIKTSDGGERQSRTLCDMAGRQVRVPANINHVYSTGQPGVVLLYTLCPEKLLGWCFALTDDEAAYINAQYLTLPTLGLMQGSNNTASREEIIARAPDIILLMSEIGEETISDADKIQQSMGIPVVVADYALERMPETYRFMGELLACGERAAILGAHCESILKTVAEVAPTIPEKERVNFYYAQASSGLQTAPVGSAHTQVLECVGGKNVVELTVENEGRVSVNMEQVLSWDPEVVIASYSMGHIGKENGLVFDAYSKQNDTWQYIRAVRDGRVYTVPSLPWNFLDMPPSSNRIIGLIWAAETLYPEYYQWNVSEETRIFYKLFYGKTLSDEDINIILG